MSTHKHALGPWSWHFNSASTVETHCIEIMAEGRFISVASLQSYTTDDYDDRAETIANALLISAAPDLLNALSALADAASALGFPCDAARAAIAKATGAQA